MGRSEPTLRERALRFLARREYSRRELEQKLTAHAEDGAELAALLDDLTRRGWLSELRFTEQIIQARRGKYGAQRIAHELREKGVSPEAVAEVLPQLRDAELEAAKAVWAKKFGQLPRDAKEKAKQLRFLASRGFGQSVIWKVLQQQDQDQ